MATGGGRAQWSICPHEASWRSGPAAPVCIRGAALIVATGDAFGGAKRNTFPDKVSQFFFEKDSFFFRER